jgi:hypothetical protein
VAEAYGEGFVKAEVFDAPVLGVAEKERERDELVR